MDRSSIAALCRAPEASQAIRARWARPENLASTAILFGTVEGAPSYDLGRDGDFAINTGVWEIYGPKASGQWGTGTPLRGNKRNGKGDTGLENVMGGPEGVMAAEAAGFTPQATCLWQGLAASQLLAETSFRRGQTSHTKATPTSGSLIRCQHLMRLCRSMKSMSCPDEGKYNGDMVLFDGALFVWSEDSWIQVGGAVDFSAAVHVGDTPPDDPKEGALWWSSAGDELTLYIYVLQVAAPLADGAAEGDWVPASPPVSLDGIEQHTMELEANVQALWKSSVPFDVFQPYAQKIDLLETELDKLEGVFIDVDLTYKFGYAPQRAPEPGAAYLRYGDDNSSQKPTYEQAHWLNVSNVDRAGNLIDWASVVEGNEITIESLDGSGFGIYKCYDPVFEAENWIKIQLVLDPDVEENCEGKPVEYELVRIKCSDSAGLSNYVRKSGDTMNGTLNISNVPESKTGDGPLKLYGLKKSPTSDDIITSPIFQGGHVPTGSFLQYTGRTSNNNDLVNKGYVDNKAQTSEVRLSQLADDIDPELKARMDGYDQATQENLNNEIGWTFFNQSRKGTRTSTNLNIVQNTKVDGQWTFIETENPETELPQVGEFFLLDADNKLTQEWAEAKTLRINGGDGRAADLSTIRRGTQWLIQDVALNTFAHYITNNVEFTGNVEGGQFIVEAEIAAIFGRAFGAVPAAGTVCEVKAFSPHPCISTDDGNAPIVDDDGYLWYDEKNQKLFVSDWDDDQNSNGEATWIEVGAGSGGEVTGDFVSLYGNNVVEPNGGEWRIQGSSKTFIKVDTNAKKLGLFNLQDASEDHHAISRGWAKSHTVQLSGNNKVKDGWKIQGPEKTHFHVENNQTKIYWLQDPDHDQHPVTRGWSNRTYLPLSGGTITGKLSFATNARIDCNNSNTVLSERGCFELRANADKPLIFSSGSGSKKLLSFYGYDDKAPDKRSEKAYISAGGEARFNGVYSNGKELATKEYVDANAGGGGGGAIANSGTNENPSLKTGELYLCTKNNTLYIGS